MTSKAITDLVRGALVEDVDGLEITSWQALVSMLSVEELRGYLRGIIFMTHWEYRDNCPPYELKKARLAAHLLEKLEKAAYDSDTPF